jgi:hypothetical protein
MLMKKTSSSTVPTKLKIQKYSTLLCFDRIQIFWNVMLSEDEWFLTLCRTVVPSFAGL